MQIACKGSFTQGADAREYARCVNVIDFNEFDYNGRARIHAQCERPLIVLFVIRVYRRCLHWLYRVQQNVCQSQ